MPSIKKIIIGCATVLLLLSPLAVPLAQAQAPTTGAVYGLSGDAEIGNAGATPKITTSASDCAGFTSCVANTVYWIGPGFASWIASTVATFFDFVVGMSLNSTAYALSFLTTSWTLVLSLANMFFIFILIYTAFVIMLKAETARTMQILAWVIAIALVVNFSFFFTRVVIDAGNILGTQFYNAVVVQNNGGGMALSNGGVAGPPDITANLMSAIGVEQLLGSNSFNLVQQVTGTSSWGTLLVLTVIYLSVAIMFWIIAAALLMAGIKFFLRIVGLWFVLIASPLAFVSKTLPRTQNFFDMWLRALVSLSFYPAVFLFMFYVLNLFVTNLSSGNLINAIFSPGGNTASTAATNPYPLVIAIANVSIRVGFIIVMLYIMLRAADWLMEQAGGLAGTLMNRSGAALLGAGFRSAATVGAFAGRNVPGRIAYQAAQSGTFKNWAGSSRIGNALWRATDKAGKGTFDVRNAPGGGLVKRAASAAGLDLATGTASKRSFDKIVSDKAKRDEEMGKALKATDNEAILNQKQAIEAYDKQNGPGSYQKRMSALQERMVTSRDRNAKMAAGAALATDPARIAKFAAAAKKADMQVKTAQKSFDTLAGVGKKIAEADAKSRINQFADRLQKSPAWGHALGAVKVRKLVTDKSTSDKFKELAKEAVKEEEDHEPTPTGGGGAAGGGGASGGGGGGGHGPATTGGGGSGTHASSASAPSAEAHEQTELLRKIERDVRKTNEQTKESFSHLGQSLHTAPSVEIDSTKKLEKRIDQKLDTIANNDNNKPDQNQKAA